MKKIKIIIIFLFITLSWELLAQDELNRYFQIAAENNPGLKVKFNEYMAALQRVPQVGALPDPTVAFSYFIQPVETRKGPQNARISATQMFPWFGSLSARKNTVEAIAKSKYELFKEAKSKLFFDVRVTYYNLFFTEQAIAITLENINILSSIKSIVITKVKAGLVSTSDAYRVEMEINDLQNQVILLQDNLSVLSVKFNKLLNVDRKIDIQIVDELPDKNLISKNAELDSIMNYNNVLSSFTYQLEGLEYQKIYVSKERLPNLSVGLEYIFVGKNNLTTSGAGNDAFVFPKVGLTIPLYRLKYKAKIQEVVYLQKAKRFERLDKMNTLTIIFESVWKDYQDAYRRFELYHKQADLAKKTLAILESNYVTSNLNFEEILKMEQKLLKYSLELQKASADKQAAIAFIQYLKGK